MNALVMYDHQTDSLWSHFTGDAVRGEFKGTRLEVLPAIQTTWSQWRQLHPDTLVLDKEGGSLTYDIYADYYEVLFQGKDDALLEAIGLIIEGGILETYQDDRLPTREFVVGVVIGGEAKAYSFRDLNDHTVVNDSVGGTDLVVTFVPTSVTANSFSREVDGRTLTFRRLQSQEEQPIMVDQETNSQWLMVAGEAIEGALKGSKLERLPSNTAFWFAWKDWHPSTEVFLEDAKSS